MDNAADTASRTWDLLDIPPDAMVVARCDREEDMTQAYHHFAQVLGITTAVPAASETRLKSVRPGDPARAPLAKIASAPPRKAKAG